MKFLNNVDLNSNEVQDTSRVNFATDLGEQANVPGALFWAPDDYTLSLGTINGSAIQIGQETVVPILNQTGSTLNNGQVIGYGGTLGASGIFKGKLFVANGADPANFLMGIVTHNILNGEIGHVTIYGKVRGINTTGGAENWQDGDILYASPTIPGALTNIKPTAPNLKIIIATVIRAHAKTGVLHVNPSLGSYLGDDHNSEFNNEINGDFIIWNDTLKIWENKTRAEVLPLVTTSEDGLMSSEDKVILDTVYTNNHIHSNKTILDNTTASFTTADESKLDGIANGANNYTLPVASATLGGVKSGTDITIDASGNVSVNDDSHNHVISNVDGLQTALDGKVDNSRVLTDVPSGAKFTDTVYTHPANHPPSIITQDSSNRFVTDAEKTTWNGKSNFKNGTGTFPTGTTYTVTDAFITANTLVTISPTAEKKGVWAVNSADGSFTITSDTPETTGVTFDWGAIK